MSFGARFELDVTCCEGDGDASTSMPPRQGRSQLAIEASDWQWGCTPNLNDTDKFYDVLLPFLTGKPLESSLAEEEERISKHEESTDWRSPQKARTASLRALLEALHFLLRRQGLSQTDSKQVSLGLRVQFVKMMFHDLHFVPLDTDSRHLINIATRQLAYCTAKHCNRFGSTSESASLVRVFITLSYLINHA